MLEAAGAIKIAQALKEYNKSLYLSILSNKISEEAKDEIVAILSNNLKILCHL